MSTPRPSVNTIWKKKYYYERVYEKFFRKQVQFISQYVLTKVF